MSTLLQRLAGQAIGAPALRVRAAERVRPQVPIAMPAATTLRVPDDAVIQTVERMPPPPHRGHDSKDDPAPRRIDRHESAFSVPERATPHLVTFPDVASRAVADPAPLFTPMPAPLLGEVARSIPVKAAAGSLQPAARPAAIAPSSGEPAEVHVHIGRIEVTTVQPPAPPARKREGTPRRNVALSDYLAKRRVP